MQSKRRLILFVTTFTVVFGLLTIAGPLFGASKEKVLYAFEGGARGAYPLAGLVFDSAGNLYGTTESGGWERGRGYGFGTVFQLVPRGKGKWTEEVLLNFMNHKGEQAIRPRASLILDAAGNLYGTTQYGGHQGQDCDGYGCGSAFQLTPGTNGTWILEQAYYFNDNGSDGYLPRASLILDAAGNLYGTTPYGGASGGCDGYGCGTVFELIPGTDGAWTESVLYSFCSLANCNDGAYPYAGLIFDAAGNLYGTTNGGGDAGAGTVFELTPGANGTWTETVLHSFGKGKDGTSPTAGLIFDAAGNLYGTTNGGGDTGVGTVFELMPGADGKWTEKVLHSFDHNGSDGYFPYASLTIDAAGNLYGTTYYGGEYTGGTVFRLALRANGKWTEKILHSFPDNSTDGFNPYAGLILDAAGNLYGTTELGPNNGLGTVFEITP